MTNRSGFLLAVLVLSLAAPAFADDDDSAAPAADEAQPATSSNYGVGAKTTYEVPDSAPEPTEDAVPAPPPARTPIAGPGPAQPGRPPTRSPVAVSGAGLGAGGSGVTCGLPGPGGTTDCEVTDTTPNHFDVSKDLASMKQHMGAHGGMVFSPSNGYAVGFFPNAAKGNDGVGHADVTTAPPFPNQGCRLAMWLSAIPGGAPYGGSTFEEAVDAGCAGAAGPEGTLYFTTDPEETIGCHVPVGVRSYLNVQTNMAPYVSGAAPWWGNVPDTSGKFGWRQRICDGIVGSPLGFDATDDSGGDAAGQGTDSTGQTPPARVIPACNVCLYNNGGGSCLSCLGTPVNCKICPAGTPGPGK